MSRGREKESRFDHLSIPWPLAPQLGVTEAANPNTRSGRGSNQQNPSSRVTFSHFFAFKSNKLLPSKHLHHTISAPANNPLAILAPHNRAYAFAAHDAVVCDFLCAGSLLQTPESQRGIVARSHKLPSVGAEGQARYRCRVCPHAVRTLA
jgi:hypothetical protein